MPFKLTFEVQYPDEKPLKRALVVHERVQDLSPAFGGFCRCYRITRSAIWRRVGRLRATLRLRRLAPCMLGTKGVGIRARRF
jgi:hypothetical protein